MVGEWKSGRIENIFIFSLICLVEMEKMCLNKFTHVTFVK